MRKGGGEHPFCVLIYMNFYIFHICFILFILLSYLIFDFVCLTLSSADTHGIAKYARTHIRDTHTGTHTKKEKRKSRKIRKIREKNEKSRKTQKQKKSDGESGKKERKKNKRQDEKRRGERRRKMREKGGRKKKDEKKKGKKGGRWVYGGRGAWVLTRAGPHTNNARSTLTFSVFHHLQNDKQRKQRHSLKLGKKRRESSKRNFYIISPRVIIKAIIIIIYTYIHPHAHTHAYTGKSM